MEKSEIEATKKPDFKLNWNPLDIRSNANESKFTTYILTVDEYRSAKLKRAGRKQDNPPYSPNEGPKFVKIWLEYIS